MLPTRGGALADLIRVGVELANQLTDTLQATIHLHRWVGSDVNGKEQYASHLVLTAIVEPISSVIKTADGQDVLAQTYIGILQPLDPLEPLDPSNPRRNPVDERDKIILPDGTTGPIYKIKGIADAATNMPFFSEIWLGRE